MSQDRDTRARRARRRTRGTSAASIAAVFLLAGLTVAAAAAPQAPGGVGFLTRQAAPGDARDIAIDYLRSVRRGRGLEAADIDALEVTDRYRSAHNGVTHLNFRQRHRGIPVVNGTITVNVTADGRVINASGRLVRNLAGNVNALQADIEAEAAVRRAGAHLGLVPAKKLVGRVLSRASTRDTRFEGAGLSLEEIDVALRYYAVDAADGSRRARLAWELDIRTPDHADWWVLWVDARTGEVLDKANYIANDTYEVYALPLVSPDEGPRTIEVEPAETSLASPFGWHDTNGTAGPEYTDTRGNNVFAQEDRDANNTGGARPAGGTSLDFQYPLDLTQPPVTYTEAATVNLFYWNNLVHDILYAYGFDEASGNFQVNNYGRGGVQGDPVQADAQDGSGVNNANFATPPDGGDPRMQMFEWTAAAASEFEVLDGAAAGLYTATGAGFGPAPGESGVTATVVRVDDGVHPDVHDGCEPIVNGAGLAGSIALINRGGCTFVAKVGNAQQQGAAAVLIVNNVPGSPINLGDDGTGGDITIPSGMIALDDGEAIAPTLPVVANFRSGTAPVDRDSDLDAGVIVHEYVHGLSNRLTGGPGNTACLSNDEQMGEGWSDWYAVAMTARAGDTPEMPRGVGTYLIYQPTDGTGIRSYPYSTDMSVNPMTYADIATESVPHGVGSVWATMLWDMYWNLVEEYGFDPDLYAGTGGNNLAIQLVTDGMKLQPCRPGFVDGRDAILLADQVNNGGANQCLIWAAFAKRGLGVSASQGSAFSVDDGVEAFDLPAECTGGGDGLTISGPVPGEAGVENCYEVSGAEPGAMVRLVLGLQPGQFQPALCDEPLGVARPFLRDAQAADAAGSVTLCTAIPGVLSGRDVLAQALIVPGGCALSNVDVTGFR